MKYFSLLVITMLLLGCSNKPSILNNYLRADALPLQSFVIQTNKDTTLLGIEGIKVFVAKGTFEGIANVTLELREAVDFGSIVKAGLLTISDGKPLQSGGMFYLGTKENAAIKKPIRVSVPTGFANPDMQLYKGKINENKIDWENPVVIAKEMNKYEVGENIFKKNCTSCHKIDKDLTAPALAGSGARRSRKWLYAFTRNWQEFAQHDVSACIAANWGPTVMNIFPALTDTDLNDLYNYIDAESYKAGYSSVYKGPSFIDSCQYYKNEYSRLLAKRNVLTANNKNMVERDFKETTVESTKITTDEITPPINNFILPNNNVKVSSSYYQADYYDVQISSSGWYNIDRLLNEETDIRKSKLKVKLEGQFTKRMETYLAIPSHKILTPGGVLSNKEFIGFYNTDGTLPLPQQAKAMVFTLGETKGEFFFAKVWFNIQASQTINLTPLKISKEQFQKELDNLGLEDVKPVLSATKNLTSIRSIDSAISKIKYIPNGDCDCGQTTPYTAGSDTSVLTK